MLDGSVLTWAMIYSSLQDIKLQYCTEQYIKVSYSIMNNQIIEGHATYKAFTGKLAPIGIIILLTALG